MRTAALLGVVVLLSSGCVAFDPAPRLFEVKNLMGERLGISPLHAPPGAFTAESGELIRIAVDQEGCDSRGWVATSSSGDVVAQITGACLEYRWTIRGVNDSTYESYR